MAPTPYHLGRHVWVINVSSKFFGHEGVIVSKEENDRKVKVLVEFSPGKKIEFSLEDLGFEAPIVFYGPQFTPDDKVVQIQTQKLTDSYGNESITIWALTQSGRIFEKFNQKEWVEKKGPNL